MVPWRIRLLLSFVSIVTAGLICIACLIVAEGVLDGYLGSIRTPAVTFAVGVTISCSTVGCFFRRLGSHRPRRPRVALLALFGSRQLRWAFVDVGSICPGVFPFAPWHQLALDPSGT